MDIALLIVLIIILATVFIRVRLFPQVVHRRKLTDSEHQPSGQRAGRKPAFSYKSVSVVCDVDACAAARNITDKRFLTFEAPVVPLPDCTSGLCSCKYVHHQDRRMQTIDRRALIALSSEPIQHRDVECLRNSTGRRRSDWKPI